MKCIADRDGLAVFVDLVEADVLGTPRADEVLGATDQEHPVGPERSAGHPEVVVAVMAMEEWHV